MSVQLAPVEAYWKSLEGLLKRVEDLAHNLAWSTVNNTTRQVLLSLEADPETAEDRSLDWNTVGDDQVCEICDGNEGEYDPSASFLPDMPAHVACRCWWSIIA